VIKPRRTHSKTSFILEKILWRWENNWYDDGTVSNLLGQSIDELATRSSNLSGKKQLLRRFHHNELTRFDNLRGESAGNVKRLEFREAVNHIKESNNILIDLEAAIPLIEHYDSINKLMKELSNLSGETLFASTPTMKILSNLQAKTKLYLEAKETQKAKLNLFVCLEEIKCLLMVQMNKVKSVKLKGKISHISEVLEQTHKVKSLERNKKKFFLMIDKLTKLVNANYLVLAERLLEDLETEISDRISYMAYQNISLHTNQSKSKKSAKSKKMIYKFINYFDEKAKHGLKRSLKVNLNQLKDAIGQVNKTIEKEI
jgi:hypothetical protein